MNGLNLLNLNIGDTFSVVRSFLEYSFYMNPVSFFNAEAFSSVDNKPYTDASAAQQRYPQNEQQQIDYL